MITLPEWYQNEANRAELADLLVNPVLKRAFELVGSFNTPVFRSGVSTKDLALIHAFQAGVHHVHRTLHVLSRPPAEADTPAKEWEGDHIVPPIEPDETQPT